MKLLLQDISYSARVLPKRCMLIMRRVMQLGVLVALIGPLAGVAGPKAKPAVKSETLISFAPESLAPAQAQADFDLMRKALEEAHSGLYRYSSKAEMDRTFDAERAKLSRPLSKPEFMAVLVCSYPMRAYGSLRRRRHTERVCRHSDVPAADDGRGAPADSPVQ